MVVGRDWDRNRLVLAMGGDPQLNFGGTTQILWCLDSQLLLITDEQGMKLWEGEKGQGKTVRETLAGIHLPSFSPFWLLPESAGLPDHPGGPSAGGRIHRGADRALGGRHPLLLPVLPAV